MHIHITNRKRWAYVGALLVLLLALFASSVSARDAASVPAAGPASPPAQSSAQKDAPFSCAQIAALGIDKQMNMHAAQLLAQCGKAGKPADASASSINAAQVALKKFF